MTRDVWFQAGRKLPSPGRQSALFAAQIYVVPHRLFNLLDDDACLYIAGTLNLVRQSSVSSAWEQAPLDKQNLTDLKHLSLNLIGFLKTSLELDPESSSESFSAGLLSACRTERHGAATSVTLKTNGDSSSTLDPTVSFYCKYIALRRWFDCSLTFKVHPAPPKLSHFSVWFNKKCRLENELLVKLDLCSVRTQAWSQHLFVRT